ncbi:pentapeptide repeat-containing protein [Algivirga pacifica]|uniref:Pentapeptide repeat-containing protein n=1 Tax=Algivirga pacifica TaxID=1162670 RepID=A0ABP9D5T6_9BACT
MRDPLLYRLMMAIALCFYVAGFTQAQGYKYDPWWAYRLHEQKVIEKEVSLDSVHFRKPFILGVKHLPIPHLESTHWLNLDKKTVKWYYLKATDYSSKLSFEKAYFEKEVHGTCTIFNDLVSFHSTRFGDKLYLLGTHFENQVNFNKAIFEEQSFFEQTAFMQQAYFYHTVFKREAFFAKSHFESEAYFYNTKFEQEVNFSGALFDSLTYFEGAHFKEYVNFSQVKFDFLADYSNVRFERKVDFTDAHLPEYLNMENVKTKEVIDLSNVIVKEQCHINLHNTDLSKIKLDYQYFQLTFLPEWRFEKQKAIYGQIIQMQEYYGFTTGLQKVMREYKQLMYTEEYGQLLGSILNFVSRYWWDYGFRKDLIFKNTALLFLFFFSFNIFAFPLLIRDVYEMDSITKMTLALVKPAPKEPTPTQVILYKSHQAFLRVYLSFFFTAYIFFSIMIDTNRIRYNNQIGLLYFFLMYLSGFFCLLHMVNALLQ